MEVGFALGKPTSTSWLPVALERRIDVTPCGGKLAAI